MVIDVIINSAIVVIGNIFFNGYSCFNLIFLPFSLFYLSEHASENKRILELF